MSATRLERRRFLAAIATGLATGVAGCGYRPGGGEFAWQIESPTPSMLGGSSDGTWHTDGHTLFLIRNRSGRTLRFDGGTSEFVEVDDARVIAYRATGESAWSHYAERQYVGDPAADDGRVYLSLEDGGLTALEEPDDGDAADGTEPVRNDGSGPEPRWTTDWDGPPLSLHAAGDVLVGVHEDGLVGFDADDGAERFALERESLTGAAVVDVALAPDRLWVLSEGEREGESAASEAGAEANADGETETGPSGTALYGIGVDGAVETTRAVPDDAAWLETIGGDALVGVGDEVRAIAPDGDRRFAVDLEGTTAVGTPIPVADADRCYHYSHGTLEAIDVADGEVVWRRTDRSLNGTPVADADGVYGRDSGIDGASCGLVATASDGDRWWEAPLLDELGCSGELLLVDDRLVVVSGGGAYGFRKAPSDGLTIL